MAQEELEKGGLQQAGSDRLLFKVPVERKSVLGIASSDAVEF